MSATGVSTSVLAGVPLLAGADDVSLAALSAEAEPLRVLAGEWALREGDEARELYVVLRGRLRVVAEDGRTLRILGPGGAIGELALLTGAPRSASVQAVRDSTLLRLPRERFDGLMERDAHFAATVARELAVLLQASGGLSAPPARPALFALRALGPEVPIDAVARSLARALERFGTVEILRADAAGTGAVERAEDESTHVLLVDETGSGMWSDLCTRQADRLLLVATSGSITETAAPDADLLVLGPAEAGVVGRLMGTIEPRALHRLATTEPDDPGIGRLARRLVGRALGIVLSGGGARGFAHIGALQALEEAGLRFDRFGGTSIGAFMSALAAAERTPAQIVRALRSQVVEGRPFADWTVPRHALIRGRRATEMFGRVLGAGDVRQLPRSWFGVSVALASAELVVHRDGPVAEAVGCSMSLPGIAPPRVHRGRLLIDGGVLNNLPVDVMLADREGPVVAVDVAARFQVAHGRPQIPPILETLGATMVLTSRSQIDARRAQALLVVEPELADVGLLDWDGIDRAVRAGREAANRALERAGPELAGWRIA